MSRKLSKKLKDAFAAMISIIALALVLSFLIAPLFPTHALHLQFISVVLMTISGTQLAYKIVKVV